MQTETARSGTERILSIYQFFIEDFLQTLNALPLENQLVSLQEEGPQACGILVLDFCGMTAKLHNLFQGCDLFLVDQYEVDIPDGNEQNSREDLLNLIDKYDVVYSLVYLLQPINFITWPGITVICSKNKVSHTICG